MKGMQNKTIKKVLRQKLDDWLTTIEDFDTQCSARQDVIVTGGAIPSLIMGDPIKDYDVYFRTKETTMKVAEYYVNKFIKMYPDRETPVVRTKTITNAKGVEEERVVIWVQSSGVVGAEDRDDSEEEMLEDQEEQQEDDQKPRYCPVFLSENAISLSHSVQLVTRFYGSPAEIHDNFDFIHAMCYYDMHNDELHTPVEALRSMQSMTLRYVGSLYPVCSLFRLRKFIKRGWSVSAGEILKVAMQVSSLDLSNPSVLREQLVGVDALYFNMLVRALATENAKEKFGDEEGNIRYPTPYVIEVINRIFNDE